MNQHVRRSDATVKAWKTPAFPCSSCRRDDSAIEFPYMNVLAGV
jgi:hypothetical protein